jgi:hypothetical protein
LRDLGGAGDGVAGIARVLGERGGNGGGHATMARAVIPLDAVEGWSEDRAVEVVRRMMRDAEAETGTSPELSRRS